MSQVDDIITRESEAPQIRHFEVTR
jgi:hypothetical protein